MRSKAILFGLLLALGSAGRAQASDGSQGEYLARAGDCVACHSVPGGAAFAGGLKMGSPLGAIYATNITPDPDSGIGRYTLQDFDRALRRGIAKDGRHLYPAMPYPSYAKLTDADVAALYAYFMKEVPPSQQPNKPTEIPTLLSFRWPIAIWNALFAGGSVYTPKPNQTAEWNRGAYLVQGLEHCGACHTPRAITLQEKSLDETGSTFLAGAPLDGWSASNLRGDLRTGLGSWSAADIAEFLKHGHNKDGAAFGSMTDVVNNSTPYLTDADLAAIAVYLKSLPPAEQQPAYAYDNATTASLRSGHLDGPGAAIYATSCASCHGADGRGFSTYLPPIAGNPTTLDKDASSMINLVLNGSAPLIVNGAPSPYRMPQFRLQLTDQQIAEVLTFTRSAWGNGAGSVTAPSVADLRKTTDATSDRVVILRMR